MTAEKLRLFKWQSNEVNIFPECTFINIRTLESFIKIINKGTSLTILDLCVAHMYCSLRLVLLMMELESDLLSGVQSDILQWKS